MNLLKYFPIAEKHIKPTSCPQKGSFRFVQKASECTGDFISGCRMNDELEIQQNCPIRRRSGNEGFFGNSLWGLLLMLTKNILYHLNISIYDNNLVLFLNNCVITNCISLGKAMFIKIKVLDGRITNKHKKQDITETLSILCECLLHVRSKYKTFYWFMCIRHTLLPISAVNVISKQGQFNHYTF